MRFLLISLLLLFALVRCNNTASAQEIKWNTVHIKGFGQIEIPDVLELQSGTYKELQDNFMAMLGFNGASIMYQPRGINDFDPVAMQDYARVIIDVRDIEDEGILLNTDASEVPDDIQQQINTQMFATRKSEFEGTPISITKWIAAKYTNVNGYFCLYEQYERKNKIYNLVRVHRYSFFNRTRLHSITFSSREPKISYWESIFTKVLASFRVDKVR